MRYILRTSTVILISLLIITFSQFSEAKEVISNSADWQDVYSTVLYGNLAGANPHFLTGVAHGPLMLYEIPKSADSVEIITSADKPFYVGYESLMRSKGYTAVTETILNSANLELAKKLPQINKFIILDDAYGYNALAVAPYAAKAKYYVLFANRRTIDDVVNFLSTKNVEKVIIYGHTDREVRNRLTQYNPDILNSETGSRFENNMLIVDKYAEVASIKQAILTNGEFIEASMMTGNEPVIFIGKNNVPQEIKDYIKKRGIDIGVLIGNELIGTATDVRRQVGISVFVKFARGSRVPGGTINPVEDLDRFPMPSYQLSMSITSVVYNRATGSLEVTYKNNVNLAAYFKSTITVKSSTGETIVVDGDNDTIFINGEETKTVVYTKLNGVDIQKLTSNLTAEVYTIYGESKTALENVIRATLPIEIVDVKDDADIKIISLVYDKSKGQFIVIIENTGKVDAYVNAEIFDIWVNGEYISASSNEIIKIEPGKTTEITISIQLDEEDLVNPKNKMINVRANYGERTHALIKFKIERFELKIKTFDIYQYVLVGAVILLILLLLFFLLGRRRKKKCDRCKTRNDKDAKVCKKCGQSFEHR